MFNEKLLPVKLREYAFIYNKNRSEEYNLAVAEYPSIPRLQEDCEDILVEGKSSSYTVLKGTYRDRVIKFKFKTLDVNYFWSNIEIIEKWLISREFPYLFYDRVDKCFRVKRVEIGDISKEMSLYGNFEVTFICDPFMTDLDSTVFASRENTFTLENRGDFEVEPIIILEGNGNFDISINGEVLQIKNVVNKVTIDSKLMSCMGANGSNKLKDMVGNFPILKVGENKIVVNNSVTVTTIKYRNLYR